MASNSADSSWTMLESLDTDNQFFLDNETILPEIQSNNEFTFQEPCYGSRYCSEVFYDPYDQDSDNEEEINIQTCSVSNLEESEEDDETYSLGEQKKRIAEFIERGKRLYDMILFLQRKYVELHENKTVAKKNIVMPQLKKLSKTSIYQLTYPYFKDKDLFPCPPNEDVKLRTKMGIIPDFSWGRSEHKYWNPAQKGLLRSYIKDEIIEKELTNLRCEKIKLKKSAKSDNKKKAQMKELDDEMTKLKDRSLTDLMKGKDDWEFDWEKISNIGFKGEHSAFQCSQFWHIYLKPSINKSVWTKAEDKKLLSIAEKHGYQDWDRIVKKLGTGRSAIQAFTHFNIRFNSKELLGKKKSKIDREEAEELNNIILNCTIGDQIMWRRVQFMTGHSVKKLVNFWKSSQPGVVKGKFRKEEDMLIIAGIQEFGLHVRLVAMLLKHRTANQIKSRYHRLIPTETSNGPWKVWEDELLLRLVDQHGVGKWSEMAKQFITRDRTQIRHRYNALKDRITQDRNLDLTKLRRNNCKQEERKRIKTDKMVIEVKKKMLKLTAKEEYEEDALTKSEQFADIKSLLFKRHVKKSNSNSTAEIETHLTHFFREYYHPCKNICKYETSNIADLARRLLFALIYLDAKELKSFSRVHVESLDCINDVMKSVLIELMYEDLFDFQIDKVKDALFRSKIVEDCDQEFDCNCSSSISNIDYFPEPATNCLIEFQESWLSSDFHFKNENCSSLINSDFGECSNGVYKFIKDRKADEEKEQALPKIKPTVCKSEYTRDDRFWMPMNISTLLFLRTFRIAKFRLKTALCKTASPAQDNVQNRKNVLYPRKFTEQVYASDQAMNLPETRILMKRIRLLMHYSLLFTQKYEPAETSSPPGSPNLAKWKRSKLNGYLKKRKVLETYVKHYNQDKKKKTTN